MDVIERVRLRVLGLCLQVEEFTGLELVGDFGMAAGHGFGV
jgi:hypothetical protein